MKKPKLYLFIGYPGAGKTSTAKAISKETGAVHLWADVERHRLFPNPTHSPEESNELYDRLNQAAAYLLKQGKSVVFDTNFNFYADRQKLNRIAKENGAETVIIWVSTPAEVAKKRSVGSNETRNGYITNMSEEQFDSIVEKLEPPRKDEKVIKIDGTKLDREQLTALLKR